MTDNFSQIKLRLPKSLKERISLLAKQRNRSLNAEIIDCLERSSAKIDLVSTKSDEALSRIISQIAQRAINFADKTVIFEALPEDEKTLLSKLDSLPTPKKEKLLKALIMLLDSI